MQRIVRNSKLARFVHWIHTISCLLLFYTGVALYIDRLNFLMRLFGGMDGSRLVHRICAAVFIGIPVLGIIFNFKAFSEFMKEVFSWEEGDTKWLMRFPKYLFKASTPMPPSGKLKAGQKFADWFVLGSAVLISLTGIVMLWPNTFPTALVMWCYPLHVISMIVLGVMLLGHIYLGSGIFQPYRGAIRMMFGDGTVSKEDAEYHWAKWAKEVESEQK